MKRKINPKIMYIGPLNVGSTCKQRMNALQDLGCVITPFDTTPYLQFGMRIERSMAHRLSFGRSISKLNNDLVKESRGKHYDFLLIDKGTWIYPETLLTMKNYTKALLVHYTPDPAFLLHRTRHFIHCVPHYDVMVTSKIWEVDQYRKHGARKTILLPQGYDPTIFKPWNVTTQEYGRLRSRICFVGHCEKYYHQLMRRLIKIYPNKDVAIWGQWQRHAIIFPSLRKAIRGNGIWGIDYAKALCCSEIGLGFLSKLIPETSTTRTFEIPACGTFLLAERTEEHLSFFKEGIEAEFFSSDEELLDKADYYLKHSTQRSQIASAGRRRCVECGYSYHDRMRQLIKMISDIGAP